jgi:hypothetical protein
VKLRGPARWEGSVSARWIRGAVAALALVGTLGVHSRLPAEPPLTSEGGDALLPDLGTLRLASLGFDALVGDFYWLRALQVVGNDAQWSMLQAPLIGRLAGLVVGLDPWVGHPYRFTAVWMTDSPDSVRVANRIVERGIAYHPDDWRNRFYLSFNHFFYLGDPATAAAELEPAIHLEGAPGYLGRLHARLRSEHDGLEAGAAYLTELVRQTEDPYQRAAYEKALDEIETERRARYLDQARDEYRRRNGRDITNVEDLARGPDPVLSDVPPDVHGWGWVLDPQTGQIESAFYGTRYQLNLHPTDQKRLEEWSRREREKGDEG